MKVSARIALGVLVALGAAILFRLLVGDSIVALVAPHGSIASQERDVIIMTALVMLSGAVPTLVLLYFFAWRYRAGNPDAKYDPDRPTSVRSELALWAAPAALVAVLWGVVWGSAHSLDPYKPISASAQPMTIQVVALRWKWLFIYPKEGIATVNQVEFPANTPIHFELTADAPMSSFWIPQLGSQIYAMASMMTQLNLIADPGEYAGRDTEINGVGYSDMTFVAKAVPREEFADWVRKTRQSPNALDDAAYAMLAEPSTNDKPASYASVRPDLFDAVMMKYMGPAKAAPEQAAPPTYMPSM